MRALIEQSPEGTATVLSCRPGCGQFQTIPLLWKGKFAGTLVLERSLADTLLTFNALTGAEIAIDVIDDGRGRSRLDPRAADYLDFPVVTFPERTLPLLRAAGESLLKASGSAQPALTLHGDRWFEIFRVPELAAGVDAFLINDVTEQRLGIQATTHKSILIGALGVILSELLLLAIMKPPLRRLKHLASVLPLLAEKRFGDLRKKLAPFDRPGLPHDEIDLMVATVGNLIERMERLQGDRELAEEQLLWLADHDPLTRLMNRRRFKEDFIRIVDQAVRYDHEGALLFLDLDAFKDVNDFNGHQVGDSLLQEVAERLRSITRPSDLLARLGGDEFALVLPEASMQDATGHADAAQDAIRSITLDEEGRQHRISASIGIVCFPSHGHELPQLMANADLAMYQAKQRGPGRWHLFSAEDPAREQLDARVLWKERIDEALREDRFELFFQPIIDIPTGTRCHMEALIRMRDAQGALIGPDHFIPVAEKTGQIQSIDQWLLDHALRILSQRDGLRVALNLSANAMDDPTLLTTLQRLLHELHIEPSRLSFEITERVAIDSLSSATRLMLNIRELGCRFALDDFGSGYASYAYMRQLPVDDIKIDGAFIRELPHNREDRIFVKAITDMAHGTGKRVIAEYVETQEILEILQDLGVDCAQGYLFGKPAPLDDFYPAIRSHSARGEGHSTP